MKATMCALAMIALTGLLFTPQADAQRSGFIVGIAPANAMTLPPNNGFIPQSNIAPFMGTPVQPFITAPVQGFGVNPFSHHPRHRAQVIGPATYVVQQPPQSYFFAAGPPPGPAVQPNAPLAISTPRSTVISRLGLPLVSVFTPSGETLYYNGGITVFIQNGQVVLPR
jgi:hypothetical protein